MTASPKSQRGVVLITTLYFMVVLLALMAAFFMITNLETGSYKMSRKSTVGFYAAEAGLNVRAEQIRQIFVGYNRPTGTTPAAASACTAGNMGSGDYACQSFSFGNRTAKTFIEEEPGNPLILTIPPGELYQNLNAQEYRYTVKSTAYDHNDNVEAKLELRFKSRLVPLFQFVAFYDKDLEILPGPSMTLSGPVHTNGDLYLQSDNVLSMIGQISTAGKLFRGRKNDSSCNSNSNRIMDPAAYRHLQPSCPSRTQILSNNVTAWNGMIRIGVADVTVPAPEVLDPTPGQIYWDKADLRLVLKLTAGGVPDTAHSPTGVEVRTAANALDTTATNNLHAAISQCQGQVTINGGAARVVGATGPFTTSRFYNNRESGTNPVTMLEVDMRGLLNCIRQQNLMGAGKTLNDSSEGGLVFHFGVEGPNSGAASSRYGVRIRNAQTLQATTAGAPLVRGMTVVSNQAVYPWGNYNSTSWIPAAILSDSVNPLSNNWRDAANGGANNFNPLCPNGASCSANSGNGTAAVSGSNRVATDTYLYTALLAGTDTTGGIEGTGGQGGAYNGGLENYPRFHEEWGGRTFYYLGSFVSLGRPRHANGTWVYGGTRYTAPTRLWDYDTRFNNAANLPPLTPRFVYLRQELFVRDYEQ
ncbi:MAG: hypothetical protein K1X83_09330 [Oligoflexia bacterium]|nr:hypothetical protein [Oligoflexia bacterium]